MVVVLRAGAEQQHPGGVGGRRGEPGVGLAQRRLEVGEAADAPAVQLARQELGQDLAVLQRPAELGGGAHPVGHRGPAVVGVADQVDRHQRQAPSGGGRPPGRGQGERRVGEHHVGGQHPVGQGPLVTVEIIGDRRQQPHPLLHHGLHRAPGAHLEQPRLRVERAGAVVVEPR